MTSLALSPGKGGNEIARAGAMHERTRRRQPDGAGIEPLDLIQFGWVNLTIPVFGSSDQIVVASGAVLGGSGIVVGTLEAIPEPSAAGLISLATLAFGGRRTRS